MAKEIKVGIMPGRLTSVVVENGTSIREVLQYAELDTTGYDIQVDGNKITDPDSVTVNDSTNLVLLVKQVKGNAPKTVKVGIMPGRLSEFGVETGTSIADVLQLAELDYTGYDVQVDGTKITDLNNTFVNESTNLVLLVKQVKGNK